jgi:hypothetical protein
MAAVGEDLVRRDAGAVAHGLEDRGAVERVVQRLAHLDAAERLVLRAGVIGDDETCPAGDALGGVPALLIGLRLVRDVAVLEVDLAAEHGVVAGRGVLDREDREVGEAVGLRVPVILHLGEVVLAARDALRAVQHVGAGSDRLLAEDPAAIDFGDMM